MLLELRIDNFAVIERVDVRLRPGLNVLTGETGAGKSIIVDALGLLLGERASSDVVRPGAERARIEGVFDVAGQPEVLQLLDEQGLASDDGLLILRREVAAEGRNRAWVNGAASTAGVVGRLGRMLVDLHGQHEHQNLLRPEEQRAILDAYAGAGALARDVAEAHAAARHAERELAELDERRQAVAQRAEQLRFEAGEIEAVRPEPGEDAQLQQEARRLEHAEELARLATELHDGLYASERSVTAQLAALRRSLDRLLRIDASRTPDREALDSVYYAVEELGRRLGDYAAAVEHDPRRLEDIGRRQDAIFKLLRKYGSSIEEVLEAGRRARTELELLDSGDVLRRELADHSRAVRDRLQSLAAELGRKRAEAAGRLAAAVQAILPDLGLAGARFVVAVEPLPEIGRAGGETIEFRASLNPGFDARPVSQAASGGELSRIMLALKAVLAAVDEVPSLVFDEIDAGIGGQTANKVAAKLRDVAASHQVFAITHLPQIAARAHHHLHVEKWVRQGATVTAVTTLEGAERVAELVRLLGGDVASAATVKHAKEMLRESASHAR
jgi:DNA repair protein RecN (Recombination protein N)